MNILVFDTGAGGRAVADEIQKTLPDAAILSINDHSHMPYGNKSADEVFNLTQAAIAPYLDEYNTVVIACNTATTNAIAKLRETYPSVRFIGVEPMVKPAAQLTKTKKVAVCATPATLASARYQALKQEWLSDCTVIEPDCSDWASLIEDGHSDTIAVEQMVDDLVLQDVDVIVLACTHYHLIKQRFIQAVPATVLILEPSDAITRRIIDMTQ
jgi:glutamate racemase